MMFSFRLLFTTVLSIQKNNATTSALHSGYPPAGGARNSASQLVGSLFAPATKRCFIVQLASTVSYLLHHINFQKDIEKWRLGKNKLL